MNINKAMINTIVTGAIDNVYFDGSKRYVCRLRRCTATVWETEHWWLLKSYATFVAAIDKQTGILYDYLRCVYGYTPTSAHHISKFAADYHATQRYTYRP